MAFFRVILMKSGDACPADYFREAFFGRSKSFLRQKARAQKARKLGLLGSLAFDLYMKIALSQAEVLCKDSKMDCIFTPGVNARTYACCGRVSPKGWGKIG